MTALVIGLVLFLGLHSTRMVADGARSRFIAQRGQRTWRGLYSLGSALGFVLIIWGFARHARRRWCCGHRPNGRGRWPRRWHCWASC
jgi:uncharacterized membrane protein